MNITLIRTARPAFKVAYTPAVAQLARKLECATTGVFPRVPRATYLSQAQFISENLGLAQSIVASLNEVTKEQIA